MQITLLTHSKELVRPTNTGQLVMACHGLTVERRVWQRNQPDAQLLACMTQQPSVLLYPSDDAQPVNFSGGYEHLILLDGTWQEARKMYNRSPYLQALPAWQLDNLPTSQYRLRRNQQAGALCTAEVVIALLQMAGMAQDATALQVAFEVFNQAQS